MTATAPAVSGSASRGGSLVPLAEAALISVSLAAVVSFYRLFAEGSFFVRLATFAVVSHGLAIVARRLRWSLGASALLSLGGLVVTTSLALYPSTTIAGIPTSSTFDALRNDLSHAYTQFQSVQAPTPVTTSFLLAAGLALWWAAFVADWAAFRLWVPFESIVPAGTVFVFASLFSAQQHQVDSTALFVACALAYLLLHRVARQQVNSGWMSTDQRRGTNSLLVVGGAFVVATVAAAALIGPHLPQADAEAIVSWCGDRGNGGSRTTISPFVEIHKRLVDQSLTELFVVKSDQRSYWRLTSLDEFDGNVWSSNGSYEKASGSLPTNLDASVTTKVAAQTFSIAQLGTIWVPAAFEPKSVDAGAAPVRFEGDSSTLIVGTDLPSSDNISYTVQSVLPIFDPAQLEAAPAKVSGDISDHYLQLPADFSRKARTLASAIAAGHGSVYDRALALQDYFRSTFSYSLDVPPEAQGESSSAIDAFLDSKQGYCEQFAGTFAAMVRSLGIPARVAVGFTPGQQDPAILDLYHVRGEHAHAWPEVYIGGQGWVLFEPTPTRGAPNAEQYTHVADQQSTGGGAGATTLVPTTQVVTPTTQAGGAVPTTQRPDPNTNGDSSTGSSGLGHTIAKWAGRLIPSLLIAALLALGIVLLLDRLRRRRRRRDATEPHEQVQVAWSEATEALELLGAVPATHETAAEFAGRASPILGDLAPAGLADKLERADFSVEGVSPDDGALAYELADGITAGVRERTTGAQRLLHAIGIGRITGRPPRRRRSPRARLDAPDIEMLVGRDRG